MKPEERVAWEKSKGFKSFGTISESLYINTKPENFKSKAELNEFLAQNSNYFEVKTDSYGNRYVDLVEHSNDYRYLMNEDKMFIIKDNVYKCVNNKLISDKLINIAKVKNEVINDNSLFKTKNAISSVYENNLDIWATEVTVSGQKYNSKVCLQTLNRVNPSTGFPQRMDRITFYNYKWTLWVYWGDYSTYTTLTGSTTTRNMNLDNEPVYGTYQHAGTNAYLSKYVYGDIYANSDAVQSYYLHYDFNFSNAKGVSLSRTYNY
jgi:hypothetical protein